MDKKLLLILNPRAGRTRSPAPFLDILDYFSQCGYLVSFRLTTQSGDATRYVVEEGAHFDIIVCCGGDGTLNETAVGLLQLQNPPPLGYIPCGSTNDFAHSLHLPVKPLEAAQHMMQSSGRTLDVGSFNGRPFIYVASFGAFTRTSYHAPQSVKNDLGHLAYLLDGVFDLPSLRPYRARIEADGEVFDDSFLFGAILNTTSIGGLVKLGEEQVVLDDGKFELLLIPNPHTLQELQGIARSVLAQDFSGVILRHVSQVRILPREDFHWSLDGEFCAASPEIVIQNQHQRLNLLL